MATALDFIGEEIEPLADTGEGTGEVEAGVTAGDGVEEVDGKAQPGRDSWCGAAKPEGEGDGEGEREGEGKGDAEEAAEDGREDSSDERGDVRRVCAASCFFCGMGIGEVGGDFTVDGTTFKSRAGTGDVFSDVGGSGGGVEGGGGRELRGLSRGKSKKNYTQRERAEREIYAGSEPLRFGRGWGCVAARCEEGFVEAFTRVTAFGLRPTSASRFFFFFCIMQSICNGRSEEYSAWLSETDNGSLSGGAESLGMDTA